MIKSRFIPVGMDQTKQFQSTYMSFLANRIVQKVPFDFAQKKYDTPQRTKSSIINKEKFYEIMNTKIGVNINSKDYDYAYKKMYLRQKNIIEP